MKKIILVLIPVFLIAISGLTSCTSCKNNKDKKGQQEIIMDKDESFEDEIEDAVYPLPTAAQVIGMLSDLEVGYMVGISNSVDNSNRYITSKSQAANLGIYGADLSYATLYNMSQDVNNYLDAIRELANSLQMTKVYSRALYDDINEHSEQKAELINILTNAFNETYAYLSENDQQSLALLVVAGAWVEGMYITTHISEAVFHVEGIVTVLLEQKANFEILQDIAAPYSDDPVVKEMLDILAPIKEVYETIDNSLTMKNVEDLTIVIESVREKLVS